CGVASLFVGVCLKALVAVIQFLTSSLLCKYEALCSFQISGYSSSPLDIGIILGIDKSSLSLTTGTESTHELLFRGARTIAASRLSSKRSRRFRASSTKAIFNCVENPKEILVARKFAAITPESQNQ